MINLDEIAFGSTYNKTSGWMNKKDDNLKAVLRRFA
jgi:hypothetical protein